MKLLTSFVKFSSKIATIGNKSLLCIVSKLESTVLLKKRSEAVPVPPVLPGSPSGHADSGYTLGSNAGVEHDNHMESDITNFAKEGLDRQRLENELAFEIKKQERLKRQNLEIENMRELEKARQEAEALASQQRLAKMKQELQEG